MLAVLGGGHAEMLFKEMVKMADRLKVQLVGDHQGGHIRRR